MLKLTSETVVFVANNALDFRKGLDRTLAVVEQLQLGDTRSGAFFVFFNRSRSLARVVCYDGSGYWIANKRLSRGTFANHPKSPTGATSLSGAQLLALLEGIWQGQRRKQKACA